MATETKQIEDYEWFKVASAGETILNMSFDPECIWVWSHAGSEADLTDEIEGVEHISFNVYIRWTVPEDLYFRKKPRDFHDIKDEPSWYKIDKL